MGSIFPQSAQIDPPVLTGRQTQINKTNPDVAYAYMLANYWTVIWYSTCVGVVCFTMLSIFSYFPDDGMRRNTKQVRKNRAEIIASLRVTDDLIHQLAAAKCISDHQEKHLSTLPLSRRSSRLLNMMLLKNIQDYKMFIGVLRRTARKDIAVLLCM